MLAELSPKEIEDVLQSGHLGRIACCDEGRPYIVPVVFAYDGKRIIFRSSAGKKLEMLRKNPQVCFEVEDVRSLSSWRTVVGYGRFHELDAADAAVAMDFLVLKLLPHAVCQRLHERLVTTVTVPTRGDRPERARVFAISLQEKTGRREKEGI